MGDIVWEAGIIHIQRDIDYKNSANAGELKTDAAYRDVPMTEEVRRRLFPRRGHPNAYLFVGARSGKPWSKATAERIWLEMMEQVSLTEEYNTDWKNKDIRLRLKATITPYYLRHNFITQCWKAGLDPLVTMRIVGHTDYRTTANIYTHLQKEHIEKAKIDLQKIFAEEKVAQGELRQMREKEDPPKTACFRGGKYRRSDSNQ